LEAGVVVGWWTWRLVIKGSQQSTSERFEQNKVVVWKWAIFSKKESEERRQQRVSTSARKGLLWVDRKPA
jgi:hypothetical protein